MSQKSIILIIILFVLLVAGMFVFAYLKSSELKTVETPVVDDVFNDADDPYADITRIDVKHYFIDGKHTLVGEVNLPTPCDLLEANAVVMESFPEQVRIEFRVINNSNTCEQTITAARFSVEALASEKASFNGQFMGRAIELNLIPAAPGEVPEDFELFIKG